MIITLLAALNGAAQQAFVVNEGAETTHFVENHSGSEYHWELFRNLNPDIPVEPTECYFTGANNVNEVTVKWLQQGIYYLTVMETDFSGCSNLKALSISVLPDNSSISFLQDSSTACFNSGDNDFGLSLLIYGAEGKLEESLYPVTVNFLVNGNEYSEQIAYDNQVLSISSEMSKPDPDIDNIIKIEITEAVDSENNGIKASENSIHSRMIFAKPQLAFDLSSIILDRNTVFEHRVSMISGNKQDAKYFWSVEPASGTSTDLAAINENAASILWDGAIGEYHVKAYAIDGNGCVSDTVLQRVGINQSGETVIVSAGNDTLIGNCTPYQLQAWVSDTTGLTYSWSPFDNLDDPTLLNPVFTPGETTEFILTVSDSEDIIGRDTVEISVSDVLANAGEDFMMEDETSVLLNGTGSVGEQLAFSWTTNDGEFVEGQNTSTPEISSAGTYYLQVTDIFGCSATDSVVVSRFISAPIIRDDYDTTDYQQSVIINVLANDEDPHGELDQSSLQIIQFPVNGVVDNNGDGTVTYTPNNGFLGGDVFEYSVCNYDQLCGSAHVYVYVMAVDFFIPEAFTPNGDNINDYFEIQGIEMFERNSITIINRWGKTVYKAKGYGIETTPQFWDGKSNQGGGNSDLPTGTYFYVLDLGNGEQPIAGSVYIDR